MAAPAVESREWPGDERAVTRFLAGDVVGFEQIVRHYSASLFSLAARLVGPSEAEDVVQETFLRAYRGLEKFRGESSLKTWLYAIALNRARARHGTLSRLRAVFVNARSSREDAADLLDDAADPGASPEEATLAKEQRTRLRAAIRVLPEEFKTAVVLRDLEGLSYEEIAQVLSVPIGTVRSRIARGRSLLKEELS
ncbi:MAG TPA: sigma-70 family RNA polymerase sigma factor [Thermoanaerobaculia bacterium]|nr:sigma-70 family RNA polymerase sigma factor [Thermoanaerobaculia bacterium]